MNWAVNNDYGGPENLSLIPGSVGSAPVQNIGAYGVEISDSLTFCETISISNFHDFKFKMKIVNSAIEVPYLKKN